MTVFYNHTPNATIVVAGTQILIHARQPLLGYPMFTNPADPGVFAADKNIGQIQIDEREPIAQIFLKIEADVQKRLCEKAPTPTEIAEQFKIPHYILFDPPLPK